MYEVITNKKQVNLSVCFRGLVHTTVCSKEQNMSSGMRPFMAEERHKEKHCLDRTQKYRERKQRQRIISRKL